MAEGNDFFDVSDVMNADDEQMTSLNGVFFGTVTIENGTFYVEPKYSDQYELIVASLDFSVMTRTTFMLNVDVVYANKTETQVIPLVGWLDSYKYEIQAY